MSIAIKNCSICEQGMVSQSVRTPSDKAVTVSFCRQCDRRHCAACGHHEQNVFARKCSACGVTY